ncbi:MAG: PLP-dependent aminotransferase family protein [Chloroflexota bacterium]
MTQAKLRTLPWHDQEVAEMLSAAAASLRPASAAETGTAPGAAIRWAKSSHADPISLGGGLPDPESLPAEALQAELDWVLQNNPAQSLRYGGVLGSDELRRALAERQSRLDGVPIDFSQLILTPGGAGGIDTICAAFLNPGDVVLVEQPVFAGTIRTIRGHSADIVGVSIGAGEDVSANVAAAVEQAEGQGKRVKLLFLIPDYQNPVGSVLSEAARAEIIEHCAQHRILIVEDSTYAELYFSAPPPPSLYTMAGGVGVLKSGTFSKIIATGLRVGWVQAAPNLIDALARMVFDMGGSPLIHEAIARFMHSGKLDAHVEQLRRIYATKCDVISGSIEEYASNWLQFQRPEGGFFLWAECLGMSSEELSQKATEVGVMFPTGANFFIDQSADTTHVRIAFSQASLQQLRDTGPRLHEAFTQ